LHYHNIVVKYIGPARRREEGMYGDGGEDEGRAGGGASGSLGRSVYDNRDISAHVEP
jgi:hypothetical protein